MNPPWITFLAAIISGVLASLITNLAAPRLQHWFWKRQRLEEIRFAVIAEVNRLAAQFVMSYIGKDMPDYIAQLAPVFFESWEILDGQVRLFFSPATHQKFSRLFELTLLYGFYSQQETQDIIPRINQFREARQETLKALYTEIGILKGKTI
jgi:hypothetical protein